MHGQYPRIPKFENGGNVLVKRILVIALVGIFALSLASAAMAKPDYISKLPADKQSQSCAACHTTPPALNDAGKAFVQNGYKWPEAKPAESKPKESQPAAKPAAPAGEAKPEVSKPAAGKSATGASATVKASILGKESTIKAVKSGNSVLVPVRDVAGLFGAKITDWDNKAKKVTVVTSGGKALVYQAKVIGSKGYVDATKLAADLGASFDAKTLTLSLSKSQVVTPPQGNGASTAQLDELMKKLDAVAKKTDDIFKVQPKFAIPMREYGQRFANMYYAAKGGNWALAAYMMKYMKGAMNPASITKPEEYKILQSWEKSNFAPLVAAMEKKDFAAFERAFNNTINSCNSCHDAMGYGMIDYKLPPQPFDQHLDYNLKTEPTDFKDFNTLK